jgi:hypothetical protein
MKSNAIASFDFLRRLLLVFSVHVFVFCSASWLNPLAIYCSGNWTHFFFLSVAENRGTARCSKLYSLAAHVDPPMPQGDATTSRAPTQKAMWRARRWPWPRPRPRWVSSDTVVATNSGEPARRQVAALWGNGDYGRLGLGALESRWSPTVCPFFVGRPGDPPASLACGGAHTLFLTRTPPCVFSCTSVYCHDHVGKCHRSPRVPPHAILTCYFLQTVGACLLRGWTTSGSLGSAPRWLIVWYWFLSIITPYLCVYTVSGSLGTSNWDKLDQFWLFSRAVEASLLYG